MADTPTTTEIKQQKGLGGFTDDPSQRLKPSKTIPPKFGSSQSAAPDYAPDPSRKDRPSKSYGLSEGDQGDPHGYLGHFANDSVVSQGHNVGAPKGKSSEAHQVARAGFRRLPGTAANQIGHAKYGDAHDELPPPRHVREESRKMRESMPSMTAASPVAESLAVPDLKMSIRHHKDRIKNDKNHSGDHKKGAIAAVKRGDTAGVSYHIRHLDEHDSDIKKRDSMLKERQKQLRSARRGKR
jgi:hypothetical protein